MTSDATLEKTREYFQHNNFFGLAQNQVFIFNQYIIPCLTDDGKLMLDSKGMPRR
jgi:UDP-N-acetylglucosamine/UDP-N-acetylgalactosamine diphosphorylase